MDPLIVLFIAGFWAMIAFGFGYISGLNAGIKFSDRLAETKKKERAALAALYKRG